MGPHLVMPLLELFLICYIHLYDWLSLLFPHSIVFIVIIFVTCRKAKKHSKKTSPTKATSDDSGLPPIPGSPGTEDSGNSDAIKSPKRRNLPVKFYIDDTEEKEHLMTAPDIVVEPPSERGSPEKWATDKCRKTNTVHLISKRRYNRWTIITWA